MRLKIEEIGPGLHPSEVSVVVRTLEGNKGLIVNQDSVVENTIEIGEPVATHEQAVLVELPAETSSGAWRVWVSKNELTDLTLEAAE